MQLTTRRLTRQDAQQHDIALTGAAKFTLSGRESALHPQLKVEGARTFCQAPAALLSPRG
jgi:hypothetical protein